MFHSHPKGLGPVCVLILSLVTTNLVGAQLEDLVDVKLYNWVNENYTKVRPRLNQSEALVISVEILLNQILEVDIRYGTISLNMEFIIAWEDEFLPLSNITLDGFVVLPADMVWTPDVTILSSVQTISKKTWLESTSLMVTGFPGTRRLGVFWPVHVVVSVQCEMDIRWFPFDTQLCPLNLSSLNVPVGYLDFNRSYQPTARQFPQNNEFIAENKGVTYQTDLYDNSTGFAVMTQWIQLKRKSQYYLVNIVTPCLILSGLGLVALLLPAECGEKISLQVTILLAYVVFLLLVSDITPPTSTIPVLTTYITLMMTSGAVSLAVTILVDCMHHNSTGTKRPPRVLRLLLIDILGCRLCQSSRPAPAEDEDGEGVNATNPVCGLSYQRSAENDKQGGMMVRFLDTKSGSNDRLDVKQNADNELTEAGNVASEGLSRDTTETLLSQMAASMRETNVLLGRLLAQKRKNDVDQTQVRTYGDEWQACAEVVDRVFTVIYAIFLVVITTFCLIPSLR